MKDLFSAINYCHRRGIVHCDLKPDNVLVNHDFTTLMVCDMGSASYENDPENLPTPYLVSRYYRAPEIILGLRYGKAVDLWSVGVTIWELITGKVMFRGGDNGEMLREIQERRGGVGPKMVRRHMRAFKDMGIEEKV